MAEPEDKTDENLWGFLGDIFEELMATDWTGSQVIVVLFVALLPVIVFCYMYWIKSRYQNRSKG